MADVISSPGVRDAFLTTSWQLRSLAVNSSRVAGREREMEGGREGGRGEGKHIR